MPATFLACREVVQLSVTLPGHQRLRETRLKQKLQTRLGSSFDLELGFFCWLKMNHTTTQAELSTLEYAVSAFGAGWGGDHVSVKVQGPYSQQCVTERTKQEGCLSVRREGPWHTGTEDLAQGFTATAFESDSELPAPEPQPRSFIRPRVYFLLDSVVLGKLL